jgi:hypothetical protein
MAGPFLHAGGDMLTVVHVEELARRTLNRRITEGTMSVKLAGSRAHMSVGQVSNWRNGKRGLSRASLSRMLAILDLALDVIHRPDL